MTFEELENLEEGTLLKIKGNGFFRKVDRLIYFEKECLYTPKTHSWGKGYMFGSTLYPVDWLKLATKKDFDNALEKVEQEYSKRISRLKDGYEKSKKAKKGLSSK